MKKSCFVKNVYSIEKIAKVNNQIQYIKSDDGTLFSGWHKTKIKLSDLPDWYIFGKYYNCHGYMSTKGIIDMVYVPNLYTDSFLKDDFLFVSYNGKIEKVSDSVPAWERYKGFDEYVSGSYIISILRGARTYSNYDISGIMEQMRKQRQYLCSIFPDKAEKKDWYRPIEDFFIR